MYRIFYELYLDSSNRYFEQKASTISESTTGHLDTLKQMSTVSKEHTQHSSKEHKV